MARIRRCNRGARGWEEVCEVPAHTREVDRVLEFHCLKALKRSPKRDKLETNLVVRCLALWTMKDKSGIQGRTAFLGFAIKDAKILCAPKLKIPVIVISEKSLTKEWIRRFVWHSILA